MGDLLQKLLDLFLQTFPHFDHYPDVEHIYSRKVVVLQPNAFPLLSNVIIYMKIFPPFFCSPFKTFP